MDGLFIILCGSALRGAHEVSTAVEQQLRDRPCFEFEHILIGYCRGTAFKSRTIRLAAFRCTSASVIVVVVQHI